MSRELVVAITVAAAVWLVAVLLLVLAGRRSRARELVALVPNLLTLFRGLIRDRRVPRSSKLWLLLGLVWILSPVDLIPEFIPIAGPLDDAIVAGLVLRHVLRRSGRSVIADHWKGDPATLNAVIRLAGM
ncbi:MAG TPA: DUF1232 domain-containing protein [Actinomycetota bacterium]|nr:DUF1232 domain-containing protein [Actinomycetota bacterium]